LLFKKQAALLRFGHGQLGQQFLQFFDMRVGQFGGKLGVFVVNLNADQAVFAAGWRVCCRSAPSGCRF
jgi:hypothetical protein